jgi:hypothetical protein
MLTAIFLLLLAPRVAPGQTNDEAMTERCLARMDTLIEQLTELEQAATNSADRAECIAENLDRIKGLRGVTVTAAARLPALLADEDTDAIAAERSAIALACARADKLAAEAAGCASTPTPKPKKRRPSSEPAAPARPLSTPTRDEEVCIKQSRFAELLRKAMDFAPDPQKPTRNATDELARFAIEPLRGWKPDECVTLDDLCVTIARALNLKVLTPNDPVSCCQALRDEGLPVDTLFPRRLEGADPPLLIETEIRAFLSKGYAAPLPSSRRLMPE